MDNYLSESRIWLKSTPHIRVLENKLILVVDGVSEYQSRLSVIYDQARNSESDRCTVSVFQPFNADSHWKTPLPDTIQPPSMAHFREQYLSQAAVELIGDAIDELHGELMIVIPQE
jgi:hypothetical protein